MLPTMPQHGDHVEVVVRLGDMRAVVEAVSEACLERCAECNVRNKLTDVEAELEKWKAKARKLAMYARRLRNRCPYCSKQVEKDRERRITGTVDFTKPFTVWHRECLSIVTTGQKDGLL